ncbi:response regulator transcription factor [Limosilactobacillus reuteri]|uniref:response regulator transcription factor n=1 Tax=Limosilactobacillus reuteri TaxID=1598 RepID=UPI00195B01B5|nr:response regulator transcription factor [Limosilactobacillus reuteri]MBM6813166.1 response regulator transcription factor [Limosilactobacillus reuteri]MCI7161411.1 response regulator transcription factor [Lactobacillus amylovorus]MCU4691293.1 response regulator transcription factor [Limosilactobacillus reuteri]MDY4728556.1 response regulator transcription factor [Lactobacillus amylovorus]
MTKILVVDDEKKIVDIVTAYLIAQKFEVEVAYSGTEALTKFYKWHPNLVVLDLMLPDLDGNEVTRRIRQDSKTPIIMLTAKSSDESIVNGLQSGADDYVVKPFSPRVVVERIKTVLRRVTEEQAEKVLSFNNGQLKIKLESQQVFVHDMEITLTHTEYDILATMAKHYRQIFTREQLIDITRGIDYDGLDRMIDSHIKNLRRKIESDNTKPVYIITVYGRGYRFGGSKDE